MTLKEYRARAAVILKLPYAECFQKISELEMEYLAQQTVPDAEKAVELIKKAKERGELPELENDVNPDDWICNALDLLDSDSPDFRFWRCENGNYMIDVAADDGEVNFISG